MWWCDGLELRPGIRWTLVAMAAAMAVASPASAQTTGIAGTVVDAVTQEPVAGAEVRVASSDGSAVRSALTDASGGFRFDLGTGSWEIRVFLAGYREHVETVSIVAEPRTIVRIALATSPIPVNEVVVSVRRSETTLIESPAAVSVVGRSEIERSPAFAPADLALTLPDVNVSTKGVGTYVYSMRGGAGTFGLEMRTLTDFRYANLPALRANFPYTVPISNEDVERIEQVRGPASALYGPLGARGILHFITRSPFDSEGTTWTATGGTQSLFQGSVRHARLVGPSLGWKVTGDYMSAVDWAYADPVESQLRQSAIDAGADPDTLLIGVRDRDIERIAGSTTLEWRPTGETTVIASGGATSSSRMEATGGVGGVRLQDWITWYTQARVNSGALFGNVFYNKSSAGSTYNVRDGRRTIDDSWVLAAQLQHGLALGNATRLQYGLDGQRTVPQTGGTIHGRYEDDDEYWELGGYLSGVRGLTSELELTATARLDKHSRIDELTFSPMVGLVFTPAPDQAWRATFNRAFTPVPAVGLFLDGIAQEIPPYTVRTSGNPPGGFRYRRDCSGLCMRSPFNPGGPNEFLPTDATIAWDAFVAILLQQGVDITSIPRPTASEVPSVLSIPAERVIDLPPPVPEINTTFEIGYKGLIGDRAYLTVDVHRTKYENGVAGFTVITPTVTLEETALAAYLGQYMPQDNADAVAAGLATIPAGTVTPENALDPYDIIVAQPVAPDDWTLWGADASLEVQVTPELSVGGTYSWIDRDSVAVGGVTDVLLGHPRVKGSFGASWVDRRWSFDITGRAVQAYRFDVGVYGDPVYGEVVPGYVTVDASVGVELPWPGMSATLASTNVFDNRHVESLGTPALQRMLFLRLRWAM